MAKPEKLGQYYCEVIHWGGGQVKDIDGIWRKNGDNVGLFLSFDGEHFIVPATGQRVQGGSVRWRLHSDRNHAEGKIWAGEESL